MTSSRKLQKDDLVVCTDGGNAPLLSEGVWQVTAMHDPKYVDYPVILVQLVPRPKVGHIQTLQTTTYRVVLLEDIWDELKVVDQF